MVGVLLVVVVECMLRVPCELWEVATIASLPISEGNAGFFGDELKRLPDKSLHHVLRHGEDAGVGLISVLYGAGGGGHGDKRNGSQRGCLSFPDLRGATEKEAGARKGGVIANC